MSEFAVLLPAAGKSSRFHDRENKPFATLDGRAVWLRTAELFVTRSDVAEVVLIIASDDTERFKQRYAANLAFMNVRIAPGGKERFESVANALAMLGPNAKYVAVHDVVRPCVRTEQIDSVFGAAKQFGAALLAAKIPDTVKRVGAGQKIQETVSREGLWLAQTPQVFRRDWLEEAYGRRDKLGQAITDDAQLVEAIGKPVYAVEGTADNIKITTKNDLALAGAILKARPEPKAARPIHPFADEEMWK